MTHHSLASAFASKIRFKHLPQFQTVCYGVELLLVPGARHGQNLRSTMGNHLQLYAALHDSP